MSEFLSESSSSSVPKLGTASPIDLQLTERERVTFEKTFRNLLLIPGEFVTWMMDQIAVRGLDIPVSQISGFSGFRFKAEEVIANESTTSTSYTDLATVGPQLTGLADGSYAVFFGATVNSGLSDVGTIGLSVNGVAPSNAAASASTPGTLSVIRVKLVDLTSDNNSLKLRYVTTSGNTVFFAQRFLAAVKFANV